LYGGYKRYHTLGNISKMRFLARLGDLGNRFTRKDKGYYARQRYINALLTYPESEMMALLLTVEDKKNSPLQVFTPNFREKVAKSDPFTRYRECQRALANYPLNDQMAIIDSMIILPDIFLEKVDKSTMAASVEVRVPFLDNDVVQFAQSIPSKIKIPNGQQKWMLKKSLEGIVPSDVLYGKKTGFGVPFSFWISSALKSLLFDNLESFNLKNPNVFDVNQVIRLHQMHVDNSGNYGFLLWKVLNFVLWANNNNIEVRV
jgi:asparagine synthase (glutamine-hydrolysing)